MRVNKYKISKKRRLRRRGKYSKKLKTKSRKSGGRFLSFLRRGPAKSKVQITATCDIPEFFFTSHEIFNEILMSSHPSKVDVIQTLRQNGKINISVDGELLSKNEKADEGRTLSVKLNDAVITKASFNNALEVTPTEDNLLTIDLLTDYFDVTKNYSYSTQGIDYSSYTPSLDLHFTCKDTNDNIMKSLLHLWRKTYNPITSERDPSFKKFDIFFKEFSEKYSNIVNLFRKHTYIFKVKHIILSSS